MEVHAQAFPVGAVPYPRVRPHLPCPCRPLPAGCARCARRSVARGSSRSCRRWLAGTGGTLRWPRRHCTHSIARSCARCCRPCSRCACCACCSRAAAAHAAVMLCLLRTVQVFSMPTCAQHPSPLPAHACAHAAALPPAAGPLGPALSKADSDTPWHARAAGTPASPAGARHVWAAMGRVGEHEAAAAAAGLQSCTQHAGEVARPPVPTFTSGKHASSLPAGVPLPAPCSCCCSRTLPSCRPSSSQLTCRSSTSGCRRPAAAAWAAAAQPMPHRPACRQHCHLVAAHLPRHGGMAGRRSQ